MQKPLWIGMLLWAAGTLAIRLGGQRFLHPLRAAPTLLLYLVSFVLMALLIRRICRRLRLPHPSWMLAAVLISFPTLVLDPFSCAFFPWVFPNLDPAAAGVFGGWMLICCGGALAGAVIRP